ncbi:MAG TPA: hypothetical protein VGN65_06710 [Casimicrobiaceae bacterium]|jgi:hypothetical protein
MGVLRRCAVAAIAAAPMLVAACGGGHDVQVNGARLHDAGLVRRDSTRVLGPGDIRISSQDSSYEVAIVGDSMVAGFGARMRTKLHTDLDTSQVAGTGIGASIEKMVKGTVANALDHELELPLSEISDVQAQDGRLIFFDKNGKRMNMFKSDKGDNDSKAFREADADAFVAAFKSRKASHG